MVTEAEYLYWLNRQDSARVVLYEFGDVKLSNMPYRGWINGKPYAYRPLIHNRDLVVKASVDAGVELGSLSIINDGTFDDLLNQTWHGEPITVRWGDPAWSYDDLRVVFNGLINAVRFVDLLTLELSFFDQGYKLEAAALTQRGGDNNELLPMALGNVFNAPLLQLSETDELQYQVNILPCSVSAVRVSGGGVAYTLSDEGRLIRLSAPTTGEARVDIAEAHNTPVAIAEYLAGLAGIETVLTRHLSDEQLAFDVGLYADNDTSVNSLLHDLLHPVAIHHRVNLLGQLELIAINHHAEADHYLQMHNLIGGSVRFGDTMQPAGSINVHYARNWSPLSESTGAASLYINDHQTLTATTNHSDAFFKSRDYDTLLMSQSDAQLVLDQRQTLDSQIRRVLSFSALAPGMGINIGDRVNIKYRRFGLQEGRTGTVIDVTKRYGVSNTIDVGMML